MKKITAALACCVVLLMGCSTPVPVVPAAKAKLQDIKSITLIAPREPWSYSVMKFADPGLAFQTLDIEVKVRESQAQQVQLTEMIKRHNFSFSSEITTQLADSLRHAGFRVTLQDGPWAQQNQGFALKFADIQSNTDAVMVIAPTVLGFVSPRDSSAFVPTVTAIVTLLNKDKTQTLYKGYLTVGWKPLEDGWDFAAATQTFPSFDAVLSNPGRAVASLKDASASVAHRAVRQLVN
jgi:hypothetical protein